MCVCVVSRFSSFQLCNRMDRSPPGSSAHGILQARILEWVAMPSSWGSSQPREQTLVSYVSGIGRQVLYHSCHPGSLYVAFTQYLIFFTIVQLFVEYVCPLKLFEILH